VSTVIIDCFSATKIVFLRGVGNLSGGSVK
jgi:hypothetical protein